jgi:tetratricopeptide (TPR) repeat protein
VLAAQLAADTPSVRDLRPQVPEELEAVVRKAMAKDPAGRFQQAAEMRAALGLSASTGHVPLRHAHWSARRRRRVAIATAAAVLLLGLGTTAWLAFRDSSPAPAASAEPLRVLVRFLEDRSGTLGPTADRMTEQLTDRLDSVPALQVTAAALVREVRHASLDSQLARFRPQRVVVGSVARADGRIRAALSVIDPVTTRSINDTTILVGQGTTAADDAAETLSLFVRAVLWQDFERAERASRVRDPRARALVEEALERQDDAMSAVLLRLDQQGFRSLDLSDSLLRDARRRDGTSDLVPVLLARNAENRAFYVEYLLQKLPAPPPGLPDPVLARASALEQMDRLIRERAGPADAFELRGRIHEGLYRQLGRDSLLDSAAADYRAATELDRHRASAWIALASAYQALGRYDDALLAVEHAATEDVFRLHRLPLLRMRFDAALNAERFAIAEEACRTGYAEAPADEQFRDCELQLWSRTAADARTAALARARADALKRVERNVLTTSLHELWVADVQARAGMGDSADAVTARAIERTPRAWLGMVFLEAAHVRLLRGDPDSALALITASVRADPSSRRAARSLPMFRPLWNDPRLP